MTAATLPDPVGVPHERRRPGSPMRDTPAGPLLVLGAARSSQTLLACALAQHPALRLVLDTSWLPRLAAALGETHDAASHLGERSALASAGVSRTDLLAAVGVALGGILPPGGARVPGSWVTSAVVTRPHEITWLLELFPTARVVHLLRHPDAVARSLATQACGDGRYAGLAAGYRQWTDSVAALVEAERAYGSARVLRLTVDGLRADADAALTRILGLLGLPPHAACSTALRGVAADPPPPVDGAEDTAERAAAVRRYGGLAAAGGDVAGDPSAAARLRAAAGRPGGGRQGDGSSGQDVSERYRAFLDLALPAGAATAVISKGDPALLAVPGRACSHLPRTPDGRYAGYHPADSGEALDHLRTAIDGGARYLVVPGATSWWLKHYPGLADYLQTSARLVAHHEDIATVYALPADDSGR